MARTWLVLDTNYLACRAFYSQGHLSFGDTRTGVLYGVMRDIINLQEMYATHRIVFAFDFGLSLRRQETPSYKAKRVAARLEGDKLEQYTSLQEQIKLLRKEYLPQLGFKNILYAKGYEADDVIASVVRNLPGETDRAVIVSSDHDFYQLLSPDVLMYNPHKKIVTTEKSFVKEWGVEPDRWAECMAIAGCGTDEVPGVEGVGLKTAARYINGNIVPKSEAFKKISLASGEWSSNLRLVRLPFPGTPVFQLKKDEVSTLRWKTLAEDLGMGSLIGRM